MVAQKGGVGKSTLARIIAVEAAKGGLQAKIADLDTQQSTRSLRRRKFLWDNAPL